MRKWLPLAVLGIGGVGALLLTDAGRRRLRWLAEQPDEGTDSLPDFNEQAQLELDRIQDALNRVAKTLEPSHSH